MSIRIMIGLLGISLMAMLGTATDVAAGLNTISCKTCKAKGGSCSTFCAGGLFCEESFTGVRRDDIAACEAVGNFDDPTVEVTGILACGNKGVKEHVAAGTNPVAVSSVAGFTVVGLGDIDGKGNVAGITVLALPELEALNDICRDDKPASTDVAKDFSPCGSTGTAPGTFQAQASLKDPSGSERRSARYACSLPPSVPNCEALADALDAGQVVQYNCVQIN